MTDITTTHKLEFEAVAWEKDDEWMRFRVGTCHGLWNCTPKAYQILMVMNEEPGNGHFKDVMEWFEHSCRRDHRRLIILEVWNQRFKAHLINNHGFRLCPDNYENLQKEFS